MKKISLFVVTAAAVALVLSGCGRGPAMDDMADEQPTMPSLDGTWHFAAGIVEVEAGAFTVTAGDGTMALGTEGNLAMLTMVVVKGTIAAQDGAYMLTVGTDADSVQLTFAAIVPEAAQDPTTIGFTAALMEADDAPVMIEIDAEADPVTITVTGSFITTLLGLPGTELIACMGTPCVMPS